MFDATIIVASFAIDLVFIDGLDATRGEEAAALLVIFLLWRILRVINGIPLPKKHRSNIFETSKEM